MSRLLVPRMLVTGSVVSSATAFRVARGCAGLWAERTPPLVALAVSASVRRPDDARTAQAIFRDDVLALARESAEISWRELRRGVDELDALTRPPAAADARPTRPHRAKP